MKKVIVAVCDSNYLSHTYSLFGNLKTIGNWKGDLAIIYNGIISKEDYMILHSKNIKIFNVPQMNPYFAKFLLFHTFFKQWDKVLYFDADFIIKKDVNALFEQLGDFLVDIEPFYIWQYFSDKDLDCLNLLKSEFNIDRFGYNTSCMLYDTKFIDENTVFKLFKLKEKYNSINQHTGVEFGTEQPILNLYFYEKFSQINNVCYIDKINSNTIASHTCRWKSPWSTESFFEYYHHGLRNF